MQHYLNQNEETIMQILWRLEKAFLKEIIDEFPEPKLPYTTIASIVKKLEKKGLIGHKAIGKTHRYFAILKQDEYSGATVKGLVKNYFEGSYEKLVSFFMKEKQLDMEELDRIYNKIKEQHKE